jgi:hypothetical protein
MPAAGVSDALTFRGQGGPDWTEKKVPTRQCPSGRKRVIGLTMVKNEQDIIEPMLRHNAALLDAMIVLDNGSVDDTRQIALALARELGNIVVTDSAGFGYTQGERMTRLLHAAQGSYFADFVLFLDADEFIGTTDPASFRAALDTIPPGGSGEMLWRNFVLADDAPVTDPPIGLVHRLAVEPRLVVKCALRLDGLASHDLAVGRGSHMVLRCGKPIPRVALPDLPLWHFPVRSHAQLTAKALVGWLACLAADPRACETSLSYHWRDMYRRIVDGTGFDGSDLRTLSLHYADPAYTPGAPPPDPPTVRDPTTIDTERRYSTGAFVDPLRLLARSLEQALQARQPLFAPEEAADAVIDIPPFRFLAEKHQPTSVLDVGCGIGLDLELFGRLGIADLAGVGRLPPEALRLRQGGYVSHDPAVAFSLGRRYALVLCLHVAADQAAWDASTLAGNVDRHAEALIAFSLSDPTAAQLDAWLARWRVLGWVADLMETLALRCLSSAASLRQGLVILRRTTDPVIGPEAPDFLCGTEELLQIVWQSCPIATPVPGLYEEPLNIEL